MITLTMLGLTVSADLMKQNCSTEVVSGGALLMGVFFLSAPLSANVAAVPAAAVLAAAVLVESTRPPGLSGRRLLLTCTHHAS